MVTIRRSAAVAAVVWLLGCQGGAARSTTEATYLGEQLPGRRPVVFMKGAVSSDRFEHGPVAIAPDLSEIYWGTHFKGQEPLARILFVRREGEGWTDPAPVPFTGRYPSGEPFLAGDGDTLIFRSDRPLRSGAGIDRSLWITRRTPTGWSDAEPLGEVFRGVSFQASMAANGTLYFTADPAGWRDSRGKDDIYRSELHDGAYTRAENLGPPINTTAEDWSPCVALDERRLLFASTRPGGAGRSDLYVSFRRADGTWRDPVNLGRPINTRQDEDWPFLTSDGKYLFFVRNGDVFWVDAGLLAKLAQRSAD